MANNMSFAGELAELQTVIQAKPQELYPEFAIPSAKAPTYDEKLQVKFFKEVQYGIVHESPFHIQSRDKAVGVSGDGIERYSDRWKPKRKAVQSLMDLRTDESFFPDELLPVLQGEVAGRKKRKQQTFDLTKFFDMNVDEPLEFTDEGELTDTHGANNRGSDEGEDAEGDGTEDEAFSDDGNDYENNYFSDGAGSNEDEGEQDDEPAY